MSKQRAPLTTRFAPSPSGPLHLGHGFAALVAHEAARASGGRFLVRIEDLDAGRSRAAYEAAIFEDLSWLGLVPDAPPLRQSERTPVYRAALERLAQMGLTYPCFCTRKEVAAEIAAIGAAPHAGETAARYPGTCRALAADERNKRVAAGAAYAVRLDVARAIELAGRAGPMQFVEAWAVGSGPKIVTAEPATHGDIVLARKDGAPAYHLAVVIDDAASGVNAVTRGEDLLEATHIQVLLQRLLGLSVPAYGHHALVRDERGKRLAKRDDARALSELRRGGLGAGEAKALLPPLPDFEQLQDALSLTRS